ncbi:unnamed protein product [Mytilus edulis]|uniref:MULE transposase domain-containing protein n=1 Tax=Mytilus edulis TaxID=6550 RepID=A0A8S3QN16_MYTED|nr:unnamed protein product [Mytilus edulis]
MDIVQHISVSAVRSMDIGGEIVPKLSKLPMVSNETDINDKYYLDSQLFCLDNEDSNLTLDSKLYEYENKSFKNKCSVKAVRSMDIGGEIVPKLSKLPIVSIETDINDKYYLDSPLFCLDNEDSNLTLDSKLYEYENKSFKNRCSVKEPQPDDSNLFILKRYNASMKRMNVYKNRISWFDKMPGHSLETMNKAIAEYIGTYPIEVVNKHGNAKLTNQEYIRTSPDTKSQVRSEIEAGKSVKQIFTDNFESEHQPRDSKYVQNVKYHVNNEKNPFNKQNIADDMQTVINMNSAKHPFLKEIVQTTGKPPSVICYTDFQMKHFASACKSSIIGVDRTFNLGACFVTTTVFQENKLKRKGKNTNPIIMGPIYLHWDVLDTTISDTLLSYSNLVIGSDEEKALVKAIKDSFPTSELTLCTRHLSENVTRHLRTKVGVNDKNAKQILSDLFGDSGLIEADTTVDFSTKITDIERKYEDFVGPYLTQKVIPNLWDYMYNARKTESRDSDHMAL